MAIKIKHPTPPPGTLLGTATPADGPMAGATINVYAGTPPAEPTVEPKVGSFLKQKLEEQQAPQVEQQAMPPVQSIAPGKPITQDPAITALASELITLDSHLKESEAYEAIKRVDEIKKALSAAAAEYAPEQEVVFNGENGHVVYSPARVETKISDKAQVVKMLGSDVYLEASTITLTALKKYLSDLELQKVTTTGFGSRTLKAVFANKG